MLDTKQQRLIYKKGLFILAGEISCISSSAIYITETKDIAMSVFFQYRAALIWSEQLSSIKSIPYYNRHERKKGKQTVSLTSMFGLNLSSNTEIAAAAPEPETRNQPFKICLPQFCALCCAMVGQ